MFRNKRSFVPDVLILSICMVVYAFWSKLLVIRTVEVACEMT